MKIVTVAFLLSTVLALPGCADRLIQHPETTPPFGSSFRYAVSQQIANPEPADDAPVAYKDGRYAAAVAEKYQEGPKSDSGMDAKSITEVIIGSQ